MITTRKTESEPVFVGYLGGLLKPNNQSLAGLMAKGASGTFVLKVVNTGLGFIMAVFLARVLGLRGYGIYAYAISWITLLGVFARLGLDQTIGRYVATYHQEGDWARIHGLLRFSFAAVAGAALACLLVASGVAWFAYRDVVEMRNALWLAFLILPISALMVPCGATLVGLQKVVSAQIPSLLVQPAGFVLLVGGAWLLFPGSLSPINVLILYLIVTCFSLAMAAWFLRRAMASRDGIPTSTVRPVYEVRDWLKSALPLMLMGSMFLANSNMDILMLGAMVGPEAAAVYKAATRGAELVVFSLSIIIAPLAPLIAKLHTSGDLERLQKGITKSAKVVFLFSLLTAIPLIVFGKYFLFLFGYEFTQGRIALNILIAGQLVNSATGISGAILVMCGLEKKAALGLLFGVTANIVLNLVLIPIWGINGAAIATCLSTILWASILTMFVMRDLKLNPTFIVFK
jgi:O-antigen/teichoic acid export membrane protein